MCPFNLPVRVTFIKLFQRKDTWGRMQFVGKGSQEESKKGDQL